MINKLLVKYHHRLVGTLAFKNERVFFQYDNAWLNNGFSLNPFKLPLNNQLFEAKSSYYGGLFGVFADSLPDSYGQLIIDRYLRNKGISLDTLNPLEKLSIIGSSGMGALTYEPAEEVPFDYSKYDLDELQEEVTNLLVSKEVKDIESLYHYGGSSGGSRPKAFIKLNGEDYIVKFSSKLDPKDITQNEYDYMSRAKSFGINVPDFQLISTKKGHKIYAIKRFDRNKGQRVHMISAAALLEFDFRAPSLDYNDLLKLTEILTRDKNDVIEMYRRMVFNVVFENLDDHGKNFSFLYDEEKGRYVLSPAYDLTKSTTYFGEHTTSVNGKGKNIIKDDMLMVAKKANININVALKIIEEIKK